MPERRIASGDSTFVIAADQCTECEALHDAPQCVAVGPVEGCIVKA